MSKVKQSPVMPRLVADDNGYAEHKLAWFDSNGTIMTGKVPAMIQVGGQSLASPTGERLGIYTVGGTEYSCNGAVSQPMDLRTADYPVSTANRVLFNHALTKFGLLGMPIKAAVTLPFGDFYLKTGAINTVMRTDCADNFTKRDVVVQGSPAQPDVKSVEVYAEALTAFFDWAITETGEMCPDYQEMSDVNGEMLIVDIGGSTTDLASLQMVDGQLLINHAKSGTSKVGVLDAKTKLSELVRTAMSDEGVEGVRGHGGDINPAIITRIMVEGAATFAGRKWTFEKERELACASVAERITSYINSAVGNTSTYFTILVVGGGAIVFREWLKKILPAAVFSDEFANAKGALKYLRSQQASAGN